MAILSSALRREQLHRVLDEMLDRLPHQLKNLDDAEQCVEEGLRRLGRASMQAWADVASTASAPPSCPDCKTPMRHRGLAKRTLVTTHGAIRYARPRRRCERCSKESYPDDAAICFVSHGVSWRAARKVSRLGSLLPSYEMTRTLLWEDYDVELCKHTIEQIVLHAGQAILDGDEASREACFPKDDTPRSPRESAISPDLVAIYADGTMIHTEDDWREIRVGRVIAGDEQRDRKRQRTFARFLSTEAFGQHLFVQAHAAGYGKAKRRAFLGDGAHWLWELASLHFPEAVPVLDWYHLSENVHAAADAAFGEATETAKQWAEARLEELWAGDVRSARQAVAEDRKRRRGARREAMRKLGVYLKNNAGRMDYARYREQDLPVGSGPVESMCKTLVGGRCKQAGMRNWTRRGAEAVLRLRAAQFDGDFHPLWESRLAPAP